MKAESNGSKLKNTNLTNFAVAEMGWVRKLIATAASEFRAAIAFHGPPCAS